MQDSEFFKDRSGVSEPFHSPPPARQGGQNPVRVQNGGAGCSEKSQDLPTFQLTADNHLPGRINSMQLYNRFRDVESDLVGTWMNVANVNIRPDGSKVDLFGPHGTGSGYLPMPLAGLESARA